MYISVCVYGCVWCVCVYMRVWCVGGVCVHVIVCVCMPAQQTGFHQATVSCGREPGGRQLAGAFNHATCYRKQINLYIIKESQAIWPATSPPAFLFDVDKQSLDRGQWSSRKSGLRLFVIRWRLFHFAAVLLR